METIPKMKTLSLILLFFLVMIPCGRAEQSDSESVKIAILPFEMNAPDNLDYLQDGIRDMLTSRLAWQNKVQVINRTLTEKTIRETSSDLSPDGALKVGKALKADYVLFGSLTAVGQSISIDAKMIPVEGEAEPLNLYAQTASMDEVIPRVNQFAQDINQKIFNRPAEVNQVSTGSENFSNRNPELLIPQAMTGGDKISYLNPNFVEVTPEEALRQSGLWKSQTFIEGIVGMDIGDLDGDGSQELVTVSYKKLTIYRRSANGLKNIGTFNATKMDRFIWVSVADINRDGRDEIFVTNMRTRNNPMGNTSEVMSSYGADRSEEVSSFGLAFVNGSLQQICDNQLFFLNAVDIPGRGKVLIGQRAGRDDAFDSEISEMQLRGNRLEPITPLALPSVCNVYNFAQADIDNDNTNEIVFIDSSNRLRILKAGGGQIWKSQKRFGASTNSIITKVMDRRYNQIDYYYLPSPILIADLNKDQIPEVVVNRSPDYSRLMPEGIKHYESGEILSLSWDQLGLVENWKTREINGMVTSLRIADLDGNGVSELVASLILAKDLLKIWEAKSTIFTYDLNVAPSKTVKLP